MDYLLLSRFLFCRNIIIIIIKYFDKETVSLMGEKGKTRGGGVMVVQRKIKYGVFFSPLLSRELLFKI